MTLPKTVNPPELSGSLRSAVFSLRLKKNWLVALLGWPPSRAAASLVHVHTTQASHRCEQEPAEHETRHHHGDRQAQMIP